MIKIYFDNVEINNDYFAEIIKNGKVYEQYFKLGATICESYKIKIDKDAIQNIPSVVTIYDGTTLLKTLYLTDYNDEDDAFYELSLEDSMTKFNFKYDASEIFVDGHTTLGEIFEDICEKAEVDTDITSFYGSTMQVSWYDNTYMARDYLGYIAEINAKNLRISANGKLEFVDINTTPVSTIQFENISNFKIGTEHTITRVVLGDWQFGDDSGETYYINEDNVYATSETAVEHIYNEINGFTYYNFSTDDCVLTGLQIGDLVKFKYNNDEYVTFVQCEDASLVKDDWIGSVKVNLENSIKQETQIVGEKDRYRRIKRTVDYDSGRITQVVEEIGDRTDKQTTITQDIDGIASQVQDIPTITTENEGTGNLYLSNLANTKLILLRIHPTDRDILGLFASHLLKASTTLKTLSRGVTFDNTNGTESDLYYKLPDNLYYYDSETYDEFVYDGKEEKIYVIRKVAVDGQGNKSILDTPITEEYEYQDLIVESGDYNVFMSTYPTAYIYVKAMIKNDYTDLFATSYEVDSKITQTANEINLEVNKKVNDEDLTGANIMLRINEDESQAQINADKININATDVLDILAGNEINMTTNNISISSNNFNVTTDGTITATNGNFTGNITSSNAQISGGTISLIDTASSSSASNARMKITKSSDSNIYSYYSADQLYFKYGNDANINIQSSITPIISCNNNNIGETVISSEGLWYASNANGTEFSSNSTQTFIRNGKYINWGPYSLEEYKKNISLYNKKAVDLINQAKIYEYNYKEEKDDNKKHIGMIIGKKYETPKDFLLQDEEGIDLYSTLSICLKAIQEQQEQIDSLKKEIKELKESDK